MRIEFSQEEVEAILLTAVEELLPKLDSGQKWDLQVQVKVYTEPAAVVDCRKGEIPKPAPLYTAGFSRTPDPVPLAPKPPAPPSSEPSLATPEEISASLEPSA